MSAAPEFPADQAGTDAHGRSVGGDTDLPQPTTAPPIPKVLTSAAAFSRPDASAASTPMQPPRPVDTVPQPDAKQEPSPTDEPRSAGATPPPPPNEPPPPKAEAAGGDPDWPLPDALLLLHADTLDDVEQMRIALENRLRSLTGAGESESGHQWGKGVSSTLPEVGVLTAHLNQVRGLEHGCELALKRAVRAHPLGPWIKRTVGVGEKQGARLLAAIGNPADRARPSSLWAFCGLHVLHPGGHFHLDTQPPTAAGVDPARDPAHSRTGPQRNTGGVAPSRTRGQKANWSTLAKTRCYLVAEACMKQRTSPYRPIYDAGRAKYADAVHAHECKRCGPSGNPAQPGSPLSAGHQHARAMRLVMKRVLLDLWREARALQAPDPAQRHPDAQMSCGGVGPTSEQDTA